MDEALRTTVCQAVGVAQDRIRHVRDRSHSIGEQNTKAILIEPVMASLGWNLEDIDEVVREYRRKPQDNPVDYAIFLLGSPRMFIEAKEVGANLNDRRFISQILGYATVVGVEWCVLTNGVEYRIYNAHAPVAVEEKLFRTVSVSDDERNETIVDTLLLLSKDQMERNLIDALWRSQFVDRQVRVALEEFWTITIVSRDYYDPVCLTFNLARFERPWIVQLSTFDFQRLATFRERSRFPLHRQANHQGRHPAPMTSR